MNIEHSVKFTINFTADEFEQFASAIAKTHAHQTVNRVDPPKESKHSFLDWNEYKIISGVLTHLIADREKTGVETAISGREDATTDV